MSPKSPFCNIFKIHLPTVTNSNFALNHNIVRPLSCDTVTQGIVRGNFWQWIKLGIYTPQNFHVPPSALLLFHNRLFIQKQLTCLFVRLVRSK